MKDVKLMLKKALKVLLTPINPTAGRTSKLSVASTLREPAAVGVTTHGEAGVAGGLAGPDAVAAGRTLPARLLAVVAVQDVLDVDGLRLQDLRRQLYTCRDSSSAR